MPVDLEKMKKWLADRSLTVEALKPKKPSQSYDISLCMAVRNDFDGVYFTVQSARAQAVAEDVRLQVVVVDQEPDSPAGLRLARWLKRIPDAVYVPMASPLGTSPSRNRAIYEAHGDIVLCVDSHVLLVPGVLSGLVHYGKTHPQDYNLWQGPLLEDGFGTVWTHMEPVWSGKMLGTWATDVRGIDPTGMPFVIPMHGLGLFAFRNGSWLGFHEDSRNFGGEEGYIHAKYRQAGRLTLCLPFMRWIHRFHDQNIAPYDGSYFDRIHNYVVEWKQLGCDPTEIRDHFLPQGDLDEPSWTGLLQDNYPAVPENAPRIKDVLLAVSDQEWSPLLAELSRLAPKSIAIFGDDCIPLCQQWVKSQTRVERCVKYGAPPGRPLPGVTCEDYQLAMLGVLPNIPETDLLVIPSTEWSLLLPEWLKTNAGSVTGWIVMRRHPSLIKALQPVLLEHSRWHVRDTPADGSWLILTCRPEDLKERPPLPLLAFTFAKAWATHVATGANTTPEEELRERVLTCMTCPKRCMSHCGACGCPIMGKAEMQTQRCPHGYWPR